MAKIVVHITGSIAAFKSIEVIRKLQKAGHQVRVVMTPSASQLILPATFASLTHHPVLVDLWKPAAEGKIAHIETADWADYSVVVPASADIIAKLASGIADDAVSTTLLATHTPVVVVPAMNSHMWSQPSVQRNIDQLKKDGYHVMSPVVGELAEGYLGKGRMPEPDDIIDYLNSMINPNQPLRGKKFLISLGGTQSPIDPVRYIGNRSSGKMGWAIAKAALQSGAQVTIVAGHTSFVIPNLPNLVTYSVQTTKEMFEKVSQNFAEADVLIMAAAVADFEVISYADQKIKKQSGQNEIELRLKPTVDILKTMGERKTNQLTIGFAAETQDVLKNAQEKLTNKRADMIIANNVSQQGIGFNADQNQVTLLRPHQEPESWDVMTKKRVGQQIISVIQKMLK